MPQQTSDFVKGEFVKDVNGSEIDFNYGGKNQKIFDGITVADAKWLAGWLSRLSDDQIRDAFRAASQSGNDAPLSIMNLAGQADRHADEALNRRRYDSF